MLFGVLKKEEIIDKNASEIKGLIRNDIMGKHLWQSYA